MSFYYFYDIICKRFFYETIRKNLCKISILKYILLIVLFYFLQRIDFKDLLFEISDINELGEIIDNYYDYIIEIYNILKNYYLHYFGIGIILNIIAIFYLKKEEFVLGGLFIAILKLLSFSFVSSLVLIFASITPLKNKEMVTKWKLE